MHLCSIDLTYASLSTTIKERCVIRRKIRMLQEKGYTGEDFFFFLSLSSWFFLYFVVGMITWPLDYDFIRIVRGRVIKWLRILGRCTRELLVWIIPRLNISCTKYLIDNISTTGYTCCHPEYVLPRFQCLLRDEEKD